MAGESITLVRTEDAQGVRFVGARLEPGGDLVIEGQDLGAGVEGFFGAGNREYEWEVTVLAQNLPALLDRLGARQDTPALAALAAQFSGQAAHSLRTWLEREQLAGPGWTRIGD